MADLRRGHVLPAVEAVMAYLDGQHPPLRFPKDSDRAEEPRPGSRWLRGGTSPSGVKFAEPADACYFVGAKYLAANYGGPQRIVWVPPPVGAESFGPPDTAGYDPDPLPDGSPQGDPRREVGQGGTGDRAFRRVKTRVVPMLADLWCNDYDDLDILINALVASAHAWNAGAPELVGQDLVSGGGEVVDEMVARGVRYQLTVTFVFPMVALPFRREVGPGDGHVAVRFRRPAPAPTEGEPGWSGYPPGWGGG